MMLRIRKFIKKLVNKKGKKVKNIFNEVEKTVQENKNRFQNYVQRRERFNVEIPNFKKNRHKFIRMVSNVKSIEDWDKLEEYLGNDELWDALIDWKSLLGENIYLQRNSGEKK